jgi:uncharacterized membrane protein
MDEAAAPSATVRISRAVAVAATLALIGLGLAWELWLAPTGSGTLAIKVAPLLLPLPGLLRFRLYTYRWLSLAIWLYAAEGAVRAGSDRGVSAVLAAIELALALIVFTACCVQIRTRLRSSPRVAAAASAAP